MSTVYNSKKLIPVETVTFTKQYQKAADGTNVGAFWDIQARGKLIPYKGSPSSSGTWHTVGGYPVDEIISQDSRLTAIIRKQEALRILFATEGASFEVQGFDGMQPTKCNPRIKGINFVPGNWTEYCDYEINLEADVLYVNGLAVGEDTTSYYISDASESWSIEPQEQQNLFRLSHNLNAKGKRHYNEAGNLERQPFEEARLWILSRVGLDSVRLTSSGVLDLPGYMQANHYVRSENVNELGGECSVTETWMVCSGNASETFTVEGRVGEDGRVQASVQGSIRGYDIRNNTTYILQQDRYTSANTYYNNIAYPSLLTRAQTYTGATLNPTKLNLTVGHNPEEGTISYNTTFDTRPSTTVTGAISENIVVNYQNPSDVIAQIPIIGRAAGPILQSLSTYTVRKTSINIEAALSGKTASYTPSKPNTDSVIDTYAPSTYTYRFKEQDDESWSPIRGSYSRNVTYVWEL